MSQFLRAHWLHVSSTICALTVMVTTAFGAHLQSWETYFWMGTFIAWVWADAGTERTAETWRQLYQTEKQKRQAIWS